jgi:hypothetical protein
LAGEVKLTTGVPGGGGGAFTVTVTVLDFVESERLSVATADRTYVPAGTLFQAMLNGATVSVPIAVLPAKNVTLLIVPDIELAFADTVIEAGAA